jgi:flagellar biosynthetic protein FlhB
VADEDDDPDSKTEDASPRRLQEAREKGQVAFSSELLAALVLAAWLGAFLFAGGAMFEAFGVALEAVVTDVGSSGRTELSVQDAAAFVQSFARETFLPALTLILLSAAVAALVGYGQVGFAISTKALEMDLGKLDPNKGVKKLFGARAAMRTLLSLTKTLLIAGVTAFMAWLQLDKISALVALEIGPALAGLGQIVLRCLTAALLTIVAIGVFDFFMQRRQFNKEMRMSKKELKEEARQSDGDPHVKARIRRVQREMAQRRMMAEVPTATVVVTNPTHYAVALKYDREAPAEKRGAPRVVAKGADHVALRIKELARESGVIVYESAPLARTLHARCEIGDEVPTELYQAVAEVLAYVFEVQKHAPKRRAALA